MRLLIFTRYATPGCTKTRLIPFLGESGAAELQRRMTRQMLDVARRWCREARRSVDVWVTDGKAAEMSLECDAPFRYVDQQGGDLGERLTDAFRVAFGEGVDRVVCIGADCPQIDPALLEQAFAALDDVDVVVGPAADGGYYLLGTRVECPGLFEGIDWGTDRVLQQTADRIEEAGLTHRSLRRLRDVDRYEDLAAWQRRDRIVAAPSGLLSIVVPTWNERHSLTSMFESIGDHDDIEVIVADGGSRDGTVEVARELGATVVSTPKGRSVQMNCGAALAMGDVLLFLHADTRLPSSWRVDLREWAAGDGIAGAFSLRFDACSYSLRLIAAAANIRSRWLSLPYGDQAIFLRRRIFGELGGFRDLPVMEDFDLVRRLRRLGRLDILRSFVTTSARKYRQQGSWRTVAGHQRMILRWYCSGRFAKSHGSGREPDSQQESQGDAGQE